MCIRDSKKQDLRILLRDVFRTDLKDTVLRSIGFRRQCLPGEFEGPPFYETMNGQRLIVASNAPCPDVCPLSKFDPLFDENPIYDDLRLSFVEWVTPGQATLTFETVLREELQAMCASSGDAYCAELTAQYIVPIVEPTCAAAYEIRAMKASTRVPVNFAIRVWKSYMRCWEQEITGSVAMSCCFYAFQQARP